MNLANSHCELFFLLRSVKQPRKGSVLGFQPYEPYELHEPHELYELNELSFLATVSARFEIDVGARSPRPYKRARYLNNHFNQ